MKKLIIILCSVVSSMCSIIQAEPDAAVKDLANRNTAFAVDLYRELKTGEGNIFFSPYSISTALAMTHLGARGETEKEMAHVLHLPEDRALINSAFSELQKKLHSIQDKKHITLGIANSLWAQQDYKFLDVFLDMNQSLYDAQITNLNFKKETEKSRQTINHWVEEKTKDKIKELLKPGAIDPNTILVLCNAIYFKGNWARQFNKEQTSDRDFYIAPDNPVKVPLMHLKTSIKSHSFDSLHVFELPYEGNDLSMIVLLPKEADGLKNIEDKMTIPSLNEWLNGLEKKRPSEAIVMLPRFKTTSEFELSPALKKMGMPSAFVNADFSGMTGARDLFISIVAHKAFVDVNEEGTEAAAATGVVMTKSAMPRLPVFTVNHPFIFLIREKSTGSILFMGRIKDPR